MSKLLNENNSDIIAMQGKIDYVNGKISELNEIEKDKKFFGDLSKKEQSVLSDIKKEIVNLKPKLKKQLIENMVDNYIPVKAEKGFPEDYKLNFNSGMLLELLACQDVTNIIKKY